MLRRFRWLILILGLVTLTACAMLASPIPTSIPVAATSESTLLATSSVSTATSAATAAMGGQVPSSCSALESLVGAYIGGVATTQSLGSAQHLSCEYANAKASNIIIVDIGAGGTSASFDALRTSSAKGGRTVTAISGLGASAFSVSKNGIPAGVSVLTAQGFVYVVESNLSIDQDESLIKQLMLLP